MFVDLEEDDSLMLETLKAQFGNGPIVLRYSFSGSYRSVWSEEQSFATTEVGGETRRILLLEKIC